MDVCSHYRTLLLLSASIWCSRFLCASSHSPHTFNWIHVAFHCECVSVALFSLHLLLIFPVSWMCNWVEIMNFRHPLSESFSWSAFHHGFSIRIRRTLHTTKKRERESKSLPSKMAWDEFIKLLQVRDQLSATWFAEFFSVFLLLFTRCLTSNDEFMFKLPHLLEINL